MHADHRQTDTVADRGRQETDSQRLADRRMLTIDRERQARDTQRYADRCMLPIKTDAVTETGRQETHREMQTDAC